MNRLLIALSIFMIAIFILFGINSIYINNNTLVFQLNYYTLDFDLFIWLLIFILIGAMLGIGYRVIK